MEVFRDKYMYMGQMFRGSRGNDTPVAMKGTRSSWRTS